MAKRRRPKERKGKPRMTQGVEGLLRNIAMRDTIPMCSKYARTSLLEHYKRGGLKLAEKQHSQLIAEMPLLKLKWVLSDADEKAILDNLNSLMTQLRKKATRHLN
ncbi:MAG: hypothetical protein Q8N60_01245, partial [Candidatus Diapherotrites archaeon]|nr:hypothetical protein [Candidatus Diapherotrites archaeon]